MEEVDQNRDISSFVSVCPTESGRKHPLRNRKDCVWLAFMGFVGTDGSVFGQCQSRMYLHNKWTLSRETQEGIKTCLCPEEGCGELFLLSIYFDV